MARKKPKPYTGPTLQVSKYRTVQAPTQTAAQSDARAYENLFSTNPRRFSTEDTAPPPAALPDALAADADTLKRLTDANAAPITVTAPPALDLKPIGLAAVALAGLWLLLRRR